MKNLMITLMLVISMLMSVAAVAGVAEMNAARKVKNNFLSISEADKILADSKAIDVDKVRALRCKGDCYSEQKEYVKAEASFRKILKDFPEFTGHSAVAQHLIGRNYTRQRKHAKANIAYLKVLTDFPTQGRIVQMIFKGVNFASMTDKEVITILKKLLRATKATARNAEFLGLIKSELDKYK